VLHFYSGQPLQNLSGLDSRQTESNRKLKPLPPDRFRHQDSVIALLKECVGAVSLSGLMFKPLTNTKTCVFFLKRRSKEIQDIGSTTLR